MATTTSATQLSVRLFNVSRRRFATLRVGATTCRTCPAVASAQRRMRASTRSMTSSGVEVPAVSPTTVAASNHSGRTSASVCT